MNLPEGPSVPEAVQQENTGQVLGTTYLHAVIHIASVS